ncbi:MAG: hypothetical protein IKV35_06950, partial [Clostridia bacterium]|nr:hypothetical protein [Clostridia bacterium]
MQFDVTYILTKEEIEDGLRRGELRRASKGRLWIQTSLLVFVAAWSLVAFFGGGMTEWMSLVIGGVALVLVPVMWFVPTWQMKTIAEQTAEDAKPIHLWVFEDGIDFGDDRPETAYYSFGGFFAYHPNEGDAIESIVLRFKTDDIVVVPRRALTDDQWDWFKQ